MRLLMKFLIGAGAGILLLITILYLDIYLGYQADLKACPMLNTQQIVPAVVEDITRRQGTLFGPFKIPAADIKLNVNDIQIGPSSVLVPFRITTLPGCQFFAMPRCSVLSNIEYASDCKELFVGKSLLHGDVLM